ncbi:MAG: ATP-dependent protease, partial [Candidatus Aenigmatarchaeota archaeon]
MKINRILLVYLFLIINIKIAIAVQKDGNPVTLLVPAIERVNNTERGVMAILQIYAKEGNGHIFIDTMPLTEIDTQTSARIAREVVSSILDLDMSNYDLFIVIRSDSPAVGGPSAG